MLTVDHQPSMSAHVGGMHLKASVWEPAQQSLQPVDVEDDQEETIYDAYDEKGPLEPAQSYFDDDEDEDEEDVSESSSLDWRSEFESLIAEDLQRQQARKEKNAGRKDEQPKAGSPKECKSAANRVHVAFGSQEEEDEGISLPDPDRPPSPACPALGTISFFYEGVVHSAKQSPSGAVIFEGVRYESIRKWMREVFQKRL